MGKDSKVLRVFLSSTSTDLLEYREQVHEALDRMRLQTSWMETFVSAPKTSLAECRRLAAEADVLVVIVAHRYGWIPSVAEGGDDEKSITWHEVDAAEQNGKPVLAFLVDDEVAWPGEREQDQMLRARTIDDAGAILKSIHQLAKFKSYLSRQLRNTFTSPDDLAMKVSTSLANWIGEQRGEKVSQVDLYLRDLLSHTDHFEIRGIARESRGHEALRPRIENLYIPLRCRDFDSFGAGEVELTRILPRSRRILIEGQPGAGKSTFLRLVACMLARDLLGHPYKKDLSWREHYLGFERGEAAPLPVLLRLALFVDLLPKLSVADDRGRLLDLLAQHYKDAKLDFEREFWRDKLERGEALLLLDGLDEVADLALRERVFRIFADAEKKWKSVLVVASRPFRTEELRSRGFRVAEVVPFRKQEIQRFLTAWMAALYDGQHQKALSGRAEKELVILQDAILNRPAVRQLAANPVMLTSLCVVHYNDGRLPEARALVYGSVIEWLLRSREDLRQAELGLSVDFAARTLAQLALVLMEGGKAAIFELEKAAQIVAPAFMRIRPGKSRAELRAEAIRWLLFECENSGIIEEIAGRKLRFWHLTFQEYLAARELVRTGRWNLLEQHLDDPYWAETLELYTTRLFQIFGEERVDDLLRTVLAIPRDASLPEVARAVGLFGRLLPAAEVCGYNPSVELKAGFEPMKDRVMAIFERGGAAKVPVKLRISAAEALGRSGDPRLRPEVNCLLPVPGKNFLLGRFPITVTEYLRFIENNGYEEPRFWGDLGWKLLCNEGWKAPDNWAKQLVTPNRPVVGVSWYEALAFCRWLTELRGSKIRLPLEVEWQAAASCPSRPYPWGTAVPLANLANFKDTEIGTATPVGIFPEGCGPEGHFDLAGNVWEWCADDLGNHFRPLKGGSYWSEARYLLSNCRYAEVAMYRDSWIGFRVAATAILL